MAHQPHYHSHGSTPAAWTAVSIVMIAFLIGGVGVVLRQPWMFWLGAALCVVGALVGYLMSLMGYGQPREEHSSEVSA